MLNKKEKEVEQDYEEYNASKRVLNFRKNLLLMTAKEENLKKMT